MSIVHDLMLVVLKSRVCICRQIRSTALQTMQVLAAHGIWRQCRCSSGVMSDAPSY